MAEPLQSIGGLASGLDTSTIVTQLMSIERQPQVRMLQKQRVEEARQNALRDVKTRLENLSSKAQALRDVATWTPTQSVTSSDTSRLAVSRTGGPPAGSWTVEIQNLARAEQWTSNGTTTTATKTDTLTIQVGAGPGAKSIDVSVTAGDSLDKIASAINAATDTPVQASVVNNKLSISGRTTGATQTISITSGDTLAADLGFTRTVQALDASYRVDGGLWTSSASNTLSDVVPGLQLTLVAPTAGAVNVTVGDLAPGKTAIKSKIQDFVDQYNSTIDFIQSKLNEKKVANPQTDSDRAKGVLGADSSLASLLSSLRAAVGDVFAGRPSTMSNLSQAGVSTGASTGSATLNQDAVDGKLTLDSAKLDAALTSSFADVKALFTNSAETTYARQGLAQRFDSLLSAQISAKGILTSRLSSEDAIIARLKDDQTAFADRLKLKEAHYRATFTAMETALSKAQQQGQWLAGQLAGLSS